MQGGIERLAELPLRLEEFLCAHLVEALRILLVNSRRLLTAARPTTAAAGRTRAHLHFRRRPRRPRQLIPGALRQLRAMHCPRKAARLRPTGTDLDRRRRQPVLPLFHLTQDSAHSSGALLVVGRL